MSGDWALEFDWLAMEILISVWEGIGSAIWLV